MYWLACFFSIILPTVIYPLDAKLTLQECQRLALENSENGSIADLHVLMEQDRIDEVSGIAYPQLKFHGDYIAAGGANDFYKRHKKANAKASLIVPLFNFGGATNLIEAQIIRFNSSIYDNIRVKQEIIYKVSQAYFKLLESKQITEVVIESITKLKEEMRISKDLLTHGLVHKNDHQQIEAQLAEREEDLVQAKNNIAIGIATLNRLMGVPLDQLTQIEDISEEICFEPSLEDMLDKANSCHPALSSLESLIQSAYYAYEGQKGALYPAFNAFGNYSTTSDYKVPYIHGVDVGISVQINLYDGGTTHAKIRHKRKEYEELQWKYQALEKDIELAVRSAYLKLTGAINKIPLAKKGVRLAEDNMKNAQEQYQEGLISSYDLLKDESELAEAKSKYYQALYDFHKAELELLFAAGIIQDGESICPK